MAESLWVLRMRKQERILPLADIELEGRFQHQELGGLEDDDLTAHVLNDLIGNSQ